MPQHGTSVNQALNEERCGQGPPLCLDGETPPTWSAWPMGAGAQVGGPLLKKTEEFTADSQAPAPYS